MANSLDSFFEQTFLKYGTLGSQNYNQQLSGNLPGPT